MRHRPYTSVHKYPWGPPNYVNKDLAHAFYDAATIGKCSAPPYSLPRSKPQGPHSRQPLHTRHTDRPHATPKRMQCPVTPHGQPHSRASLALRRPVARPRYRPAPRAAACA
jgi:hypothetical protein